MAATDPVVLPAGALILAGDTDPLEALTGAWTDYSSSVEWTASVNPAIGDGSITARYMQAGKLVMYTGRILMGATTTYGTSTWLISLPVTAQSGSIHTGPALCYDSGTAANRCAAVAWMFSATQLRFEAVGGDVASTVPFTWASSDQLRWSITYEAA